MSHWQGRTVLITGGGSGIGKALAHEFARRGSRVVVTDVNGAAAADVATEIGAQAQSSALDVRDAAAFRSLVNTLTVDVLVNNAGIGVGGETQHFTIEHWDRIIDINIRGVIHGVSAVYPAMAARRSGHIVNVASLAGLGPCPLFTPYAMTKHAVVGLSTSLRAEAALHGVQVSVLCPAAIETPLLDSRNPADLPELPWTPNARRYLERLGGKPYPVTSFARDAVDAVERNESVIVIPSRARAVWRIGRLLPRLAERIVSREVRREREAT